MCKYSVVIPCYKSHLTIGKVVETAIEQFESIGVGDYEFILVNDGSPDGGKTRAAVMELAQKHTCVTAIDLAKNAGQHNAIMAGLNYTAGEYIICMDDDMQTHPSQIPYLLAEIEKGYDVVYGTYSEKKHNWFRNLGSYFNYLTVRLLIGIPKDLKATSFWIMRRFVRDHIIEYKHSRPFLEGLVLRTTRNIGCVPIQHFERESGRSTYTFRALVKLWSNVLGYSVVPLRLATLLGYLLSATGIISAIVIVVQKLLNPDMVMGWPSLMSALTLLFGLNFLFMGLIGEYIGRVYMGINREPQYVIREVRKADPCKKSTQD